MLQRAIEVAGVGRHSQTHKSGEAYIFHPLSVMSVRERGSTIE